MKYIPSFFRILCRTILMICVILLTDFSVQAQRYDQFFKNKTLRLDYIFGGNNESQFVLLDELISYPEWAGRKHHLSELPLQGNGQVKVYDIVSNKLIYIQSFSTLFQEWLTTEEAKSISKSFENVFLVPFPKQKVRIEVLLLDNKGAEQTRFTHVVDPSDILIQEKGSGHKTQHKYIHRAKDNVEAINVAIVAEGYQLGEMDKFMKAAKEAVQHIFSHAPFGEFKEYFNFIAVQSPSEDSGISVPREKDWKNTVLSSNFDTFYSERYLTTNSVKKLHNVLAGIPYEHIIILANTKVYGGGGIYNAYTLTTAGNVLFAPVVVHEFGHSFAGLGDEYFYEGDALSDFISAESEPWEQNITTLYDFESKWFDLLNVNTPVPTPIEGKNQYPIGVYEGLPGKSIYTSTLDCRMKTNTATSFCEVCQNAIRRMILFYTRK